MSWPSADTAVPASVVAGIRQRLAARGAAGRAALADEVRDAATAQGRVLSVDDLVSAASAVSADLWGLGPLEALVEDATVTDVLVNAGGVVFVDRGQGLERVAWRFPDEPSVRALAVRLAAGAGRRLDDGCPWVDARLPGGLRLHAVLPPISPGGTHLSLRVLRPAGWTVASLVAAGSIPQEWAHLLEAMVVRRAAFLVSGGTGAGKTTLLSALLSHVPHTERIVMVEDVGELAPSHPHVVRLEARPPNVEGRGGVSLEDLVRQALRMRPDRIVVGECRGPEVRDLLAALNTGHAGGCGTVHANRAGEVPARLQALGALAGMSPQSVTLQARAALDAVVHVERSEGGRVVTEIACVDDSGRVVPAVQRDRSGDPATGAWHKGPAWDALERRLGLS